MRESRNNIALRVCKIAVITHTKPLKIRIAHCKNSGLYYCARIKNRHFTVAVRVAAFPWGGADYVPNVVPNVPNVPTYIIWPSTGTYSYKGQKPPPSVWFWAPQYHLTRGGVSLHFWLFLLRRWKYVRTGNIVKVLAGYTAPAYSLILKSWVMAQTNFSFGR